jgi:metal-responsive CopG/Arc/MetJ family transcriptional regulator
MQHIESSPVMKRNPRPRKYASNAERQAAFRARNVMVEFRAENKTADTLNKIADEIDVSRSDLVLSMVKFALTNHDWARFGLTHKTIPLYKGNPMGKDLPFKPTNTNLENEAKFLENYAKDSLDTWIVLGKTEKYSEIMEDVNRLRHTKKIKGLNNRTEYLTKYFEKVKKGDFYKGNPMATKKPSPAQLAARQKFADMVRARAAAAKGKKMPRKNPMESALLHLSGTKYGQIKQEGHIYTAYVLQKVNTGIGEEMDLLDSKSFKTKSGAANWIAKNYGRKTNPTNKFIVYSELSPQKYKQMLVTENKQKAIQTADINQMENYHSVVEDQVGHLIYDAATRKKYMTNPRKKTVSQKISQLEHEGYPHKQSIAIALSEQRRGKVRRNPSGEIGAYEITRNFKVLGIFKTKADAIKAAQGISDATGKTLAVKPVQVLAGHFDK